MAIEFDSAKSDWNVRERGLPFSMVEDFDWDTAVTREDARSDYGEPRYVASATSKPWFTSLCSRHEARTRG
jgi:uncharacterized DUF497 family protein